MNEKKTALQQECQNLNSGSLRANGLLSTIHKRNHQFSSSLMRRRSLPELFVVMSREAAIQIAFFGIELEREKIKVILFISDTR